jgi:hypothetical protein
MSDDYRVIQTLRNMEWERIKGMLHGIVASYWDDEDEYNEMRENVRKFIKAVDDGWELRIEDEDFSDE